MALPRPQPETKDLMTDLCQELLMSSTKVHISHLLVTGTGSFAAHKAMNEFYDEVADKADTLAEAYQGATERLINFSGKAELPIMKNAKECLAYMRELYARVDTAQKQCKFTEIVNELDGNKLLVDSTKYKLLFLS